METNYADQAAALSSENLLAILQTPEEYEPEAVLAIVAELEQRGITSPDLEDKKQFAQAVIDAKQEMEAMPKTPAEKLRGMFDLFIPKPGYFVTPILLNINLGIFIYMLLLGVSFWNPAASQLFNIGGNYGPYTLSGQWWRLLTSTFIHAGILHLLFNMMALVSIGRQLEQMLGRYTFIVAYIICGISGSLVSIWWDGTKVGIGASGAIFGLFGLMLVMVALERKLTWAEKRAMIGNLGLVIGVNLVFGMKDGIDNAAHAGGLVAGILQGGMLMLRSKRLINPNYYSLKGNILTAATGFMVFAAAYNLIPVTGQMRYQYLMEEVADKEVDAMQVFYKMARTDEKDLDKSYIPKLKEGIVIWNESEAILESITDAKGKDKDRVLVTLDYVRLRKKSYELFSHALQNGKPVLNEKQQKVLYAIEGHVKMLRQDRASEIANKNYLGVQQLLKLTPEDDAVTVGEKPQSALVFINGEKAGYMQNGKLPGAAANLNKDKIKSMTVLKDAEATKPYGAEGADGVILITTK